MKKLENSMQNHIYKKHETEDLQMDIHPGLGVLATGN
jgi:hypothetical protein